MACPMARAQQSSDRDGHSQVHQGDLLVAADGIRSAARAIVYPDQGPLATNGWMMYRGTSTPRS